MLVGELAFDPSSYSSLRHFNFICVILCVCVCVCGGETWEAYSTLGRTNVL